MALSALALTACSHLESEPGSLRVPSNSGSATIRPEEDRASRWLAAAGNSRLWLGRVGGAVVYELTFPDGGARTLSGSSLLDLVAQNDTVALLWEQRDAGSTLAVRCSGVEIDAGMATSAAHQLKLSKSGKQLALLSPSTQSAAIRETGCDPRSSSPIVAEPTLLAAPISYIGQSTFWSLAGDAAVATTSGTFRPLAATIGTIGSAQVERYEYDGEFVLAVRNDASRRSGTSAVFIAAEQPAMQDGGTIALDAGVGSLDGGGQSTATADASEGGPAQSVPQIAMSVTALDNSAALFAMTDGALRELSSDGAIVEVAAEEFRAEGIAISGPCGSRDPSGQRHLFVGFAGTLLEVRHPASGRSLRNLAQNITAVHSGACSGPIIAVHPTGFTVINPDDASRPSGLEDSGRAIRQVLFADDGTSAWLMLHDAFANEYSLRYVSLTTHGASRPEHRLEGEPSSVGKLSDGSIYAIMEARDAVVQVYATDGRLSQRFDRFDLAYRCTRIVDAGAAPARGSCEE